MENPEQRASPLLTRLLVSIIDDMIHSVEEMIVTSNEESVRRACQSLLREFREKKTNVQFLGLDYSEPRLAKSTGSVSSTTTDGNDWWSWTTTSSTSTSSSSSESSTSEDEESDDSDDITLIPTSKCTRVNQQMQRVINGEAPNKRKRGTERPVNTIRVDDILTDEEGVMKVCRICGHNKSLDRFEDYKNGTKEYKRSNCRDCRNKARRHGK